MEPLLIQQHFWEVLCNKILGTSSFFSHKRNILDSIKVFVFLSCIVCLFVMFLFKLFDRNKIYTQKFDFFTPVITERCSKCYFHTPQEEDTLYISEASFLKVKKQVDLMINNLYHIRVLDTTCGLLWLL